MENYQIDNLDRGILDALMANARTAYAELAKQFSVSPGTIHVRVEKMKQAGIITGARIDVSPKQLGYDVGCFIGIILKSAKDYPSALARLESLEEVTEAYYTTGHYSIFTQGDRYYRQHIGPNRHLGDFSCLVGRVPHFI